MGKRILAIFAFVLLLFPSSQGAVRAADKAAEPNKFFREYIGLSDDQIEQVHSGKPIAKIMESRTPDEVFVFGSVYIKASPEQYLKFALDLDALRKLPNYLAIQKFSDPPKLSDLDGFTLNEEDVKKLRDCKPGHCEVQLPAETMEAFQQSVNWSAPDAADEVNHLAQEMALEALQQYQQGGSGPLGTYRNTKHPAAVAGTFQSLLSRSKALPAYLPDLDHYLLDYPHVSLDTIETQFY